MPKRDPDLSLFFDILQTLELLDVPYMIIGAYAGTIYGITRVTYDIDIVVDLNDAQIDALAAAYPAPRYYADLEMMRNSVHTGIMFNIIDGERGEKADLMPLTMASSYRPAFQKRERQLIELPDGVAFEVWCARPEDVIVGKLMAWAEGRSRKHETDIYDMLVFRYLGLDPAFGIDFDETYVGYRAAQLGHDVVELWQAIKSQAHIEADHQRPDVSKS